MGGARTRRRRDGLRAPGIAHRITGGDGFLRYVFYFRHPMYPQADSSGPGEGTTFEVETVSFEELPALAEAKAREAANPRRGGAT